MSDDKFLNKFRIPSARAKGHGDDGGICFITICTAGRKHFFGEIVETWCNENNVETWCTASPSWCTASVQ